MGILADAKMTVTQIFGLAEDHIQLALLEASHEKQNLTRALWLFVAAGCFLFGAVAMLHVSAVAGLMTAGVPLWLSALGLAALEIAGCVAAWLYFKRTALRDDMFQGTRDELQRTSQWIHRHFN